MKKILILIISSLLIFSNQLFSQKSSGETSGTTEQNDFYIKNQFKTYYISVIELSNIKEGNSFSINFQGMDNPYLEKILGEKYMMIQKLSKSENPDLIKIFSLLSAAGFKLISSSSASLDDFVSTRYIFTVEALK